MGRWNNFRGNSAPGERESEKSMTRLEAMQLLNKEWRRARESKHLGAKAQFKIVFDMVRKIREAGWEVYWNNYNEPYMP